MSRVAVRLLHAEAGPGAGDLEVALVSIRARLAERLAAVFRRAGATDVAVVAGAPDDTPFGRRLREVAASAAADGLVVAGSGALALATPRDAARFLEVAAQPRPVALANNRFSADALGIACAGILREVPDLPSDNALPRWLEEVARYEVRDLRSRRHLQVDVDTPPDAILVGAGWPDPGAADQLLERLAALRAVAADRRAEVVLAGRTSAGVLGDLERGVPSRIRALVEERGLRAAAAAARGDGTDNRRSPRSILGLLLERDGPGALGDILAELGDAAVVDTRVLVAHRFGGDEHDWPRAEDRYASDLLAADRIADAWLRELTSSAAEAPIPVLLGGHTLVGPGAPLALGARRR